MTIEQKVNAANDRGMDILLGGRPVWTDVGRGNMTGRT